MRLETMLYRDLLPLTTVLLFYATTAQAQHAFGSLLLYNLGFYGFFPRVWYKSFNLASPQLNFLKWDARCDNGHYLLALRGSYVGSPAPVLLDSQGNLVWTDDGFGMVTDFKTQTYRGKEYLTFWAGQNGIRFGYGMGKYYMLDETYQVFKTIVPVGIGLSGDLHEFHITREGTALMTIYHPIPYDLSSVGGPSEGWLQDSMFQEIDIETGALLFEWKASEHVPINYTMHPYSEGIDADDGLSPPYAFDFFHINSVDKDDFGNYIISSRHTSMIMCLSSSGETIWILGSDHNMFTDLSDGRATDFRYQHHARFHGDDLFSVFDNAESEEDSGEYSRGMLLALDRSNMTATLVREYTDTTYPQLSESQGSMQLMDDTGNVVMGLGFLPGFTEFGADGQVLCDARFAPWLISHSSFVTSYRVFKGHSWVGRPLNPPAIHLKPSNGALYASWNGATEIDRWILQGGGWEAVRQDQYIDLDEQEKGGFEVAFDIDDDQPDYLRVAAVDAHGRVLGYTEAVNRRIGNVRSTVVRDTAITVSMCAVLMLAIVVSLRRRIRDAFKSLVQGILPRVCIPQRWRKRKTMLGRDRVHELEPLYPPD
ncbi:Arylsulfotransferase-domain-containing protein [Xylariaceae sp. FL1019]|nr:Arylsulfotransferase-domain-containing protein [Xylariaceae sp. FL1019]